MKWWHEYPLQEEAGDGEPGGGDPPKDPPKDPPAGDPPPEGDPPKDPGTISLEALPEDLRNRPEAEVKFLLEHMITSLGSRNTQVEELKTQIDELRGAVNAQPPKDPDPDDAKDLAELMLEDPEKALDRWAESKGYVGAMGQLSDRVGEAEFSMVAGSVDGFGEHEEAVRKLLKDGKLAATKANIMGAYTMVLGQNLIDEKARDVRANSGGIPPSPPAPGDPPKESEELSALETEIMHGHGITDPKEWIKYRDTPMKLELPT